MTVPVGRLWKISSFVLDAEPCYNMPAFQNTDHIQIDPIPVDEEDNDPVGQPI
ncbi:MAG: hypothetical protein JW934_01210 [Anaerolineae bacterium]|nr:hypothetical protein [Anaerolineae bacterium]